MRASIVLASWLLAVFFARGAVAYPQFQLSSGTTRCSQCHVSPSGGGLLTAWGRDESGDTISLGGDGSFAHGLWTPPSWLGLGADARAVLLVNDVGSPNSPETLVFPMQADVYARAVRDAWSLNVTVGLRGLARTDPGESRFEGIWNRFISREHYLMWRPDWIGPYARVGRFLAPYGLRLAEHIAYVRRFTGFNFYEETYNASGGYVADAWELHATAFVPVPTGFPDLLQSSGVRARGFALLAERRFESIASAGVHGRLAFADEEARYQGGVTGKIWIEPARLQLMAQADVIAQTFAAAGLPGRTQLVTFTGLVFFPVRGLMTMLAHELYHQDLSVSGVVRNALDLQISFFPWAHFEGQVFLRRQIIGGGSADGPIADMAMLQLHYYL